MWADWTFTFEFTYRGHFLGLIPDDKLKMGAVSIFGLLIY